MKKDMPLEGIMWSRDSDSALNNMPQTDVLGRAGGICWNIQTRLCVFFKKCLI